MCGLPARRRRSPMQYPAWSLSSLLVHTVFPVILSRATMPALRPPGVTIRLFPSTSGDSLISHGIFRAPKSLRMLRCQTTDPSWPRKHARSPLSVSTYTRSPSTVGVPLGPGPRSSFAVGPRIFDQTGLPSGRFRLDTVLSLPFRPWTKMRSLLTAIEP